MNKEGELYNIFPFMEEISYLSYDEFVDKVTESRKKMLSADKSFTMADSIFIDLNKVNGIPCGRFDTVFHGIRLDCLAFIKKESPLYIMFSASVGDFKRGEPVFHRWSYYKYCSGSVLCIADPMMGIYDNLRMGWYYGNGDMNFRKLIAEFVMKVAGILRVDYKDVVFCGSSAGGAPTFECASYISGAKAVAINPQIVLEEHSYAKEFGRITGNDLSRDLSDHRNDALYYIKNREKNPYIIIVNIHSKEDMKQIENIKSSLGINIQYGLNLYDNLVIWLYDADVAPIFNPHNACEYYGVWFFIEYIIGNINNWGEICNLAPLYRLVGEFWYEHWSLRRRQVETSRLWAEILKMLHESNKKCVVFGCGQKARRVWTNLLDIQGINYFDVCFGIDNDRKKTGTEVMGLKVKHPSEIVDWHNLYIIITTDIYGDEVYKQLEGKGLIYKQDFILCTDLE